MPDLGGVLADGPVRGELAAGGHIHEAFAAKGQAVGIVPVGTELCLQVGVVVLQDEVVVRPVPGSAVQEGGEQLPLLVEIDILRNILYDGVWKCYRKLQEQKEEKTTEEKTTEDQQDRKE